MTAIVLNDENADQKESIDRPQPQRKPNRVIYTEVHRNPKRDKGPKATEQLANGPSGIGFLILSNDGLPVLKAMVDLFGATIDRTLHAR